MYKNSAYTLTGVYTAKAALQWEAAGLPHEVKLIQDIFKNDLNPFDLVLFFLMRQPRGLLPDEPWNKMF